jgi:hypothetical protein
MFHLKLTDRISITITAVGDQAVKMLLDFARPLVEIVGDAPDKLPGKWQACGVRRSGTKKKDAAAG